MAAHDGRAPAKHLPGTVLRSEAREWLPALDPVLGRECAGISTATAALASAPVPARAAVLEELSAATYGLRSPLISSPR